ncbi:hypothetical protein A2U01_0062325, partial [Trifolium medium]|nr:hypothetical protein [Trifolium medium]
MVVFSHIPVTAMVATIFASIHVRFGGQLAARLPGGPMERKARGLVLRLLR